LTSLAVIVGVAGAYLGGWRDGWLGVITDVLLVIPLFPLLIVIAATATRRRSAGLRLRWPGDDRGRRPRQSVAHRTPSS
jgi:ABC-type dipeptide/oligopeptide/nickel transport system permease subunit